MLLYLTILRLTLFHFFVCLLVPWVGVESFIAVFSLKFLLLFTSTSPGIFGKANGH